MRVLEIVFVCLAEEETAAWWGLEKCSSEEAAEASISDEIFRFRKLLLAYLIMVDWPADVWYGTKGAIIDSSAGSESGFWYGRWEDDGKD